MKISRAILSGLAAALVAGGLAFTVAAPVAATGDEFSCPAGTDDSYKIEPLSGKTFTVPAPPAGWTITGVILKVGGGGNDLDVHQNFPGATPGQVLTVTGGHDISHAHICLAEAPKHATATAIWTPPTCLVAGSVSQSVGEGYTWVITGGDLGKTYTATPTGNYVLDGTTVFGPWRISPLTVFDTLSCRPPQPADKQVTVDKGVPTCGSASVATTTTTTPFVWDEVGGNWIEGTPTSVDGTRPLTEDEKDELGPTCFKDDKISYGEWTGEYECGDETVAETRTKTVIHYTYDDETGGFTADAPVETTENRERPATDKEKGDETCRPEKSPLPITEDIGEPECGSDTVDTRTTTTIYSYTFEDGTWVESSVQQLNNGTRPLTEDEQATLDEECVGVPSLAFVTPAGPELLAPTCDAAGDFRVRGRSGLAKEAGITYDVHLSTDSADEPGTIVIVASAEAGSILTEGATKSWKISPSQIARLTGQQCGTLSATSSTEPAPSLAQLPPVQPAQVPAPPTPAATTTVAPAAGSLPVTGGSPWTTLWMALAAIGAGFVVVRLSRRSTS